MAATVETWAKRMCAAVVGVALALGGIKGAMELRKAPESDEGFVLDEWTPLHDWTGSPEELDILEAAFRYQFLHNTADEKALETADFVFLGVTGPGGAIDPPDGLLGRFGDHPTIEPVSAASVTTDGVAHRREKGHAVLFLVWNLLRIGESACEVELEYVGGCSAWYRYRFERREGGWVVVAGGMTAIS